MAMSHLPSRWQLSARTAISPSDRVSMEILRHTLPLTNAVPPQSTGTAPIVLVRNHPRTSNHARLLTHRNGTLEGLHASEVERLGSLTVRKHDPELAPTSVGNALLQEAPRADPSAPRWTGSKTISTGRAGGLAAGVLNKMARAVAVGAAVGDGLVAASTWVPGNRFRRDLEKLVSLAAQQAHDAAERKELDARKQVVLHTRNGERGEPSPRERLGRLKAAEMAIFRREVEEIRARATAERSAEDFVRSNTVAGARANERESAEFVRADTGARRAKQIVDITRRQMGVEGVRRRETEKRGGDVETAKLRERQRRAGRARQAHLRAESSTFAASASELMRHVRKHTTMCHKAQHAGRMRKWVKGQKAYEEEMRRRLLERVKELQEQKRRVAS